MKHLLLERVAYALLLKSYSAGEPGCGWERGSIGRRVTMEIGGTLVAQRREIPIELLPGFLFVGRYLANAG